MKRFWPEKAQNLSEMLRRSDGYAGINDGCKGGLLIRERCLIAFLPVKSHAFRKGHGFRKNACMGGMR